MPNRTKIHIITRSPLSRHHAYPKLVMDGVKVTSVQMAFFYAYLIHHGEPQLAEELINNEQLKWDPVMIEPWVASKKLTPNANFIANTDIIYNIILCDQFQQPDSPIRKALEDILDTAGVKMEDKANVEFLVYTSGTCREMILSTGRKYGENVDSYPGFNEYGDVLKTALIEMDGEDNIAKSATNIHNLFTTPTVFLPSKRSVLILSDSQARYFDTVSGGGLVVPVSGGRYSHLTDIINNAEFSLNDFKYVIVYCGTNTYVRNIYPEDQRRREFADLKQSLVAATGQRERNTILFVCAFDHPKVYGNSYHARWISDRFQNSGVMCLNWRDDGNPFLDENGRILTNLFHSDRLHLSKNGAKLLWDRFIRYLPGLQFFNYKLCDTPASISHQLFAPDSRPGPSHSAKRHRRA